MEVGAPLVMVAGVISATIGYTLGRFIFRDCCKDSIRKYKWVRALDTAI